MYFFRCQCEACIKNYPKLTIQHIQHQNDVVKPFMHMFYIHEFRVDMIKPLIPDYCAFLNAKANKYPKRMTDIGEEILLRFWNVVYSDSITLGRKQFIGPISVADLFT